MNYIIHWHRYYKLIITTKMSNQSNCQKATENEYVRVVPKGKEKEYVRVIPEGGLWKPKLFKRKVVESEANDEPAHKRQREEATSITSDGYSYFGV
jgi:hypothetical protein